MTSLLPVETGSDAATPGVLFAALGAALAGDGPAVLPVPRDEPAQRARLLAAMRPDQPLEPALDAGGVAAVVPTSGSTGEPKGALLTRSALRHSAQATLDRLGGPGSWLLALPPTHVAGLQVLVRSWLAGRGVPAVLEAAGGFRPQAFAAATEALRAAAPGDRLYTALVPTQLVRLLEAGGAGLAALARYDAVLLGGAATPAPLLRRAAAAGVTVVTTYGMSETCGGCVYDGVPLAGVRWALDDAGRIRLGGPVLAAGYRLRPDLTAQAFADGWFTTADLGEAGDDGRLVVLGRADDVIVTGGEKIAPAAVEDALAGCPGVREAAVVGVDDAEWGQRVVAVVVAQDAASPPTLAAVREHAAAALRPAAAPRQLLVVRDLPRLVTGKIDRAALRDLAGRAGLSS